MKTYTEEEIRKIYELKVKKPDSYFKKTSSLPKCPVKMWNYSWNGKDLPRNFAILDMIEWIKKYNIKVDHLGYTSKFDPELEFINSNKSTYLPYPQCDLHTFTTKEKFDFFLFNQTLEHLYNPFRAVKQINKNLVKGGYVFSSVPDVNVPHSTPFHFYGYTPMGLSILFDSNDFEIVELGYWGNYDYITKIFKTGWPDHRQCSLKNEESRVAQCWILARKK